MASRISSVFGKFQKRKELPKQDHSLPANDQDYPVEYAGGQIHVNDALLSKCRPLAKYSGVFRLNETTVIKTGAADRVTEAAVLRLVQKKTTIPVPEVFSAYVQGDGRGVILMGYIDGSTLDVVWPSLDNAQRARLVAQLKGYLSELRAIVGSYVSNIQSGPIRDQFLDQKTASRGPFNTVQEFNKAISSSLLKRADNSWFRMVARFIESLSEHNVVLTHGDLAPRNILVREDKIVAIIDWEFSGFFPDYWEYVKAHLWNDWDQFWIADGIPDQVLEPRRKELSYFLHARDCMW